MQNRWVNQLWLLVIALLVFTCEERAAVDKEFLESENYKQFTTNQQEEYSAQIKSHKSLQKYLAGFSECDKGKEWTYPFKIDNVILKEFGEKCEDLTDRFNTHFTSENIGYSSFGNLLIRWLVIKKESAYLNSELIAATYKDNSLTGFQTIGVFRENLSEDISTVIEVNRGEDQIDITSAMNRGIKYPFKYDNVIESVFYIDTLGTIQKRADQTKNYNSLPDYLEEFNNCKMGKRWTLPMTMHTDLLNDFGEECQVLADKFNTNFTARTIAYTQFKDYIIRWIGMEEDSFSGDHQLMAAVFRGDTLISFQTVDVFDKQSSRGNFDSY